MFAPLLSLLALVATTLAVPFSMKLHKGTALIIIDTQNDFITGSLPNPRAPSILPKLYALLDNHEWPLIVASQDWHPPDHVSFASAHPGVSRGSQINITFTDQPKFTEKQSVVADHCIPESWGSEIEVGVRTRLHNLEGYKTTVEYVKKAQNHSIDSYSAFGDNQYRRFTTLDRELQLHGIENILVTGLVTSACVRGTAIDGTKLGYNVTIIEDATEASSQMVKETALNELRNVWSVNVMSLSQWEEENPVRKGPSGW
ncbi:Isochorismatase-like protein [Halenospora varia]|nr:Isochorismatase-like protein [Halenospora varia]